MVLPLRVIIKTIVGWGRSIVRVPDNNFRAFKVLILLLGESFEIQFLAIFKNIFDRV
jgi:hypothetical protein